jgi:hypothetical protein
MAMKMVMAEEEDYDLMTLIKKNIICAVFITIDEWK